MGNQNLISALKRANYISIEDKNVRFFEQRFQAVYIFQRHNFQMYRVRDTSQVRPGQPSTYYLRIINSLNDDDSIAIIEHMQTRLIHISHPNLVQYYAIAVEQETPHIKFVILEEDLGDDAITVRGLLDTIKLPQNKLLALYFSEKRYIYEFILQAVQALAYLNVNGKTFGELHGDISPMSIAIKLDSDKLQVKILDYLKIRDLVEIAQQQSTGGINEIVPPPLMQTMLLSGTSSPRSTNQLQTATSALDSQGNMLKKALPYDAPERLFVNQKDIGIQADIWSLGVVLFEFLATIDGSKQGQASFSKLRTLTYEERVNEIRDCIKDVAMQELLYAMLQDHENRPTAEQLLGSATLRFFSYICRESGVSLDDTDVFSNQSPYQLVPALLSALQLADKNRAIVAFFTLMRILSTMKEQQQSLHDYVFSLVMRQQAYIQIIELLVICMKEYSMTQSSTLAPIASDSFTSLYLEALRLLVKALSASEFQRIITGCTVTPSQMRQQFYLAGLFSLTLLLCEQITRISRSTDLLSDEDSSYLTLSLDLLGQFTEQASPTALIVAEKTGLIRNLFKVLQSGKASQQTCLVIKGYLKKVSCILPVSVLQQMQIVLSSKRLDASVLSNAPSFQMTKQIYKKFTLEALAQALLKVQSGTDPVDLLSLDPFQRAVTRLIYFCSIQKTLKLANAFQLCTESLKLTHSAREQGIEMRTDQAYTCRTCTNLLKGLTTDFKGSRTLLVCYSCAQLCHSRHDIEPAGFMSTTWHGCKCQLVQGFQVQVGPLPTDPPNQQEDGSGFHKCKARYEDALGDGAAKTELAQPQLILDPKFLKQERAKIQSPLTQMQKDNVRKSDLITVLEPGDHPQQSDFNAGTAKGKDKKVNMAVVYTTESFDVVSISSNEPLCQLTGVVPQQQQLQAQLNPSHSIPTVDSNFILSPALQRMKPAHTMPTNQTPAGETPKSALNNEMNSGGGLHGRVQGNLLGSLSKINLSVGVESTSSLLINGTSLNSNSSLVNANATPNAVDAVYIRDQASLSGEQLSMVTGDLGNGGGTIGSGGADLIRAYFEIKVILGGFYDQVAIGFTNQADFPVQDQFVGYATGSIALHADDGKCYINGESFEYSSPYGSQQTIGCGVTVQGDIFFTRDGLILPMIKSSAVWPEFDSQPLHYPLLLYPVVSMRGKLTTVKLNFGQTEDFVLRNHQINPALENPAVNIVIDNTMLKYLANELPKGQIQAIIESLKNFIARQKNISLDPNSETPLSYALVEDFLQRLLAYRTGHTSGAGESTRMAKNNRRTAGVTSHGSLSKNHHSSSQSNVRQAKSNLQLYSSNSVNTIGLGGFLQNQRQMPQTTKSGKSQMKFHYPQTLAQQQYTLSSQKQRSKQKSTVSPTSRIQQTSSLGQLSRHMSKPELTSIRTSFQPQKQSYQANRTATNQPHMSLLQRKRPSMNSSHGGGSLHRTDSRSKVQHTTVTLQSAQMAKQTGVTSGSGEVQHEKRSQAVQPIAVSYKQQQRFTTNVSSGKNRLTSSIDHSKERSSAGMLYSKQTNLKSSKSIASFINSGTVNAGKGVSTTSLKRANLLSHQNKNMAHSFSSRLMVSHGVSIQPASMGQATTSLTKRQNQSMGGAGKAGATTSSGAPNTKPAKNQQQLILGGSGQQPGTTSLKQQEQAALKESNIVDTVDDGLNKVQQQQLSLLKQESHDESGGVDKSSFEGGLMMMGADNYYSAGNPSSFFNNASSSQDHSSLLKQTKQGAGAEQPSSNSSAGKGNGPKMSLKLSQKTGLNQNNSLSNLMAAETVRSSHNYFSQQQQRKGATQYNTTSSQSSSIYHQQNSSRGPGGLPLDSTTPEGRGTDGRESAAAFTDQPLMTIALQNQAVLNSQSDGRKSKQKAILDKLRDSAQLHQQHLSDYSNKSHKQASHQNQQKSQPKALYKTYTDSATEIPARTGNGGNTLHRKASSSRVQSTQIHQPSIQQSINVSTSSYSNANLNQHGPDLTGTKAHQIKASYVKVPKPRITSAMSAKAMTEGPSSYHHTSVRTSQHFQSKTSTQQKVPKAAGQQPRTSAGYSAKPHGMLQNSKSQKVINFHPKPGGFNQDIESDLQIISPMTANAHKHRHITNNRQDFADQHQVSAFNNAIKEDNCHIF